MGLVKTTRRLTEHLRLPLQVNYYERSLELMRQSMEVERKDISQAFKVSNTLLAVSIRC